MFNNFELTVGSGQGLGKHEDGIVKHIKVDKKDDAGGIGIEKVAAEQREQVQMHIGCT